MRTFLVLALTFLSGQYTSPLRVPLPMDLGGGIPSYTGINCGQGQSSASTGLTCTLNSVPAHAAIYILSNYGSGGGPPGTPSITDSLGTPTLIPNTSITWNAPGGNSFAAAHVVENTTAGTHVISMVCSAFCGFNDISAFVFTGVPLSGTTESGTASQGSVAPAVCNSVTTTGPNEIGLAYSWVYDGRYTVLPDTGYTALPTSIGFSGVEYAAQATAGSFTPTFAGGFDNEPSMCIAFAIK